MAKAESNEAKTIATTENGTAMKVCWTLLQLYWVTTT